MQTATSERRISFSDEKKQLQDGGRLKWFHWAIIAASLAVTLIAWQYARSQNNTQITNRFDRETAQVVSLISERMLKYEDVLWGGVAAINSQSQGLSVSEWQKYARTLHIELKYHGINGIGTIDYVAPENFNSYLQEQRKVRPDFKVFPEHTKMNIGQFPTSNLLQQMLPRLV